MTTDLCCGVEVSHDAGHALVSFYDEGADYTLFLTPAEAERLAELLVKHAREARGK